MATGGGEGKKPETADRRNTRLAAELRSNLAKRKAQARARAEAGPDDAGAVASARPEPDAAT